jgi:hypothetical protein
VKAQITVLRKPDTIEIFVHDQEAGHGSSLPVQVHRFNNDWMESNAVSSMIDTVQLIKESLQNLGIKSVVKSINGEGVEIHV